MARRRHRAGSPEEDERGAKIDDEETKHTEHDRCIRDAHEASGRTPAAFDRIGNVWIEAVDRDVHWAAPRIRSPRSARRTRGGTKSSCRDAARMSSEDKEQSW